jgi:hypothetical protein
VKFLFLSVFFLLFSSFQLAALPSLTNKCGEKRVNLTLPSNSDIIAYDKECETVFIGPPSAGSAQVISAIPSSNLAFCTSVKTLPNVVNKLATSIEYWMIKLTEATNEALALEKSRDEKRAELVEYDQRLISLEEQVAALDAKLSLTLEEIIKTRKILDKCLAANEGNTAVCHEHEIEIKKLKLKYMDYDDILSPISDEVFSLKRKSRTLKHKLKQISNDINDNAEVFEGYKKRLRSLRNEAIEEYGNFGALEGITAQLLFESKWKEQIEYAKRNNRYSGLHITALPITKSMIHVDPVSITVQRLNMPSSLMYASVPGFTQSGTVGDTLPSGESRIDNLDSNISPINSLVSGVSGKVVLSLIGSCEFTDRNNRLKRDLNFNEISAHLSINTINEYPMLHERKHKVHFRAARFAEAIEKRTEKGGFFYTSSINEIIKDNFSDDDFSVKFETDSMTHEYSPREKELIKAEAKKEIIDRVLKEIGTVNQLAERRPRVPAHIRPSGADHIYGEVECLGWSYCYVAKFVIGVLDSIFGGKDAVAKFKANNIQQVTHTYSETEPATYAFITTFKPVK